MNSKIILKTIIIPLDQIMEDPFLTPEVLQIKNHFDYDKNREEKYFDILGDFHLGEILKVWPNSGKYFLIDNYEYLRALRRHHRESLSQEIPCLAVECDSIETIKEFSLRLKNISGTETHTGRCLNISLLTDLGFSYEQIKRFYGIKKSHSAEGRQLQRDYRIVKHRPILNRIMGWSNSSDNISSIFNLAKPHSSNSTLPYGLADRVLTILHDDIESVDKFDKKYQEYLNTLLKGHIYEEEQVKPIFTWGTYSKKKVEAIAIAVARDGDTINFNLDYIYGDEEKQDRKWNVVYSEKTYAMSFPKAQVNLSEKSDSNLKEVLEITYKMDVIKNSLESYIRRINPVDHGSKIRLQNSPLEPTPNIQSNPPRFEDPSYFNFIRKHKMLYYCNRELLLRSIGLRAHYFSFTDYRHSSETTYKKAWVAFEKWYKESFLGQIELYFNGNAKRHHLFNTYIAILNFLEKKANDEQSVYFGDFINELFKTVFIEIDGFIEARKKQADVIIRSDQHVKTTRWDEINKILEEAGLKRDDVEIAARELLASDENRLISETHKLKQAVQLLVEQTGNPLKKKGS